jgi:hypothetical protein
MTEIGPSCMISGWDLVLFSMKTESSSCELGQRETVNQIAGAGASVRAAELAELVIYGSEVTVAPAGRWTCASADEHRLG